MTHSEFNDVGSAVNTCGDPRAIPFLWRYHLSFGKRLGRRTGAGAFEHDCGCIERIATRSHSSRKIDAGWSYEVHRRDDVPDGPSDCRATECKQTEPTTT